MADSKEFIQHAARREDRDAPRTRAMLNYALWAVQVLLALLFLFAGGVKLILPAEALAGPVALPVLFLRFIGVCEVLGGLGLILPGLLRIRPGLTPLAATGLAIIMIGATVITVIEGGVAALMPLGAGILSALVVYGRWRVIPLRRRTRSEEADSRVTGLPAGC